MKRILHIAVISLSFIALALTFPMAFVNSAPVSYNVTYADKAGAQLGTETVEEGNALASVPSVTDLLLWVYNANGKDPILVNTASYIPTGDVTLTAIKTTDVTATGTLDSGNITWYIMDGKLYVTGNGTINLLDKKASGVTKLYGLSLAGIYVDPVADEGTAPKAVDLAVSRPYSFENEETAYPATALTDATPWMAYAADITEMYFASSVHLSGNMTLFFNQNSESVNIGSIKESIYTNLEKIYLFSDTSGVTRFAGTFARLPKLTHVYTHDGSKLNTSSCIDMTAMYYGDTELLCVSGETGFVDVINVHSDMSNVTDIHYMAFGCKNLYRPSIGNWATTSIKDASNAFTGCNQLSLVIDGSGVAWDIAGWDLGNTYSIIATFAGADIDFTQPNPTTNLWNDTNANVVEGNINLDLLNFSNLQVSVYAFAENKGITGVTWTSAPVLEDSSCMFTFNNNLATVNMANFNAPKLKYTPVMFYKAGSNVSNASVDFSNVESPIEDARYMFYGTGYGTINLDGTAFSALQYAEGLILHNKQLTSLGSKALGDMTFAAVLDADYMLAGNPLLTTVATTSWNPVSMITSAYMLADNKAITALDLSNCNLTSVQNMRGMAYGMDALTAIKLPASFLSGVADMTNNGAKVFYVENDTPTLVEVNASALPAVLASYNWDSDNRYFLQITEKKINDTDTTSIALTTSTTSATMKVVAESTFKLGSTPLALSYAWSKDGNSLTTTVNEHTADANALGSYKCFVDIAELTADTTAEALFTVTESGVVTGMTAIYGGPDILVGDDYSKDHVTVTITMESGKTATISSSDFSLNSMTVTAAGENTFTATYVDGTGTSWTDDFTVRGYNAAATVTGMTAVYNGPTIAIGSDYLKDNVVVTLQYSDGTANHISSDKFTLNSMTVTAVGANPYTVTYDNNGAPLTAGISVNGYRPIGSIEAVYTGPKVAVDSNYDTADVKVTAYYADDTAKTQGFTVPLTAVNAKKVSSEGVNSFIAYYTDSNSGATFSDTFEVTGYTPEANNAITIVSVHAVYTGPTMAVNTDYDKSKVIFTIYYSNGANATTDDFTVSSTRVLKAGDNSYTASYSAGGTTYSAPFTVKGVNTARSNVSNVKTGDTGILIWIVCFLISVYGLVGLIKTRDQKKDSAKKN